jgi:CTP:molybdopterin cytidylyltransferase MocA
VRILLSTAALVLAAGGSSRLGRPKQLLEVRGRPLLSWVIDAVRSWPVDVVAVVIGAYQDEILELVEFGESLIVINPEWEEGMASSLRVGLDALSREPSMERAFIALGDQPSIPPGVPEALVTAMDTSGRSAAVPRYRYQRSNPALVDRRLWPRLMSLEGDAGASRLLQAHPEWVEEVWIDHLPPRDVDTSDDAEDLLAGLWPGGASGGFGR